MPSNKSTVIPANPNERVFYTSGFDKVVTIPIDAVVQMPAKCQAKRLVLCNFFDPAKPNQSCPLKKKCNFVHADLRRATQIQAVHINYAWHEATDVSYDRFPAGTQLEVAPPGCKHIVDTMDSSLALKTKALGSTRLPLQHCAHYYYTRQCDLGSECMFVHAVFIDPDAAPLQRAPVPRDIGRGREHLVSKPPTPTPAPVTTTVVVPVVPVVTMPKTRDSDSDLSRDSPVPRCQSLHSEECVEGAASSTDSGVLSTGTQRSCSSASSSCHDSTAPSPVARPVMTFRYRHDPYLAAGARILVVRS